MVQAILIRLQLAVILVGAFIRQTEAHNFHRETNDADQAWRTLFHALPFDCQGLIMARIDVATIRSLSRKWKEFVAKNHHHKRLTLIGTSKSKERANPSDPHWLGWKLLSEVKPTHLTLRKFSAAQLQRFNPPMLFQTLTLDCCTLDEVAASRIAHWLEGSAENPHLVVPIHTTASLPMDAETAFEMHHFTLSSRRVAKPLDRDVGTTKVLDVEIYLSMSIFGEPYVNLYQQILEGAQLGRVVLDADALIMLSNSNAVFRQLRENVTSITVTGYNPYTKSGFKERIPNLASILLKAPVVTQEYIPSWPNLKVMHLRHIVDAELIRENLNRQFPRISVVID